MANTNADLQESIYTMTTSSPNLFATNTVSSSSITLGTTDMSYGNTYNYQDITYGNITTTPYTYYQYVTPQYGYNQPNNEENKKKEDTKMNFGPYNNQNIRLSPYGIAVKNKDNKWVSYDREKERIVDVDIFNIEINPNKIFYKLPKAIKNIESGDLILHNNTLMFVEWIKDNRIVAIDPVEGAEKTILPAISPFGFDYIPIIVSLADYLPEPNEDNPFGNLLPIMLSNNDNSALVPLLLMTGGDLTDIDPMLLVASSGNNSLLMLQMLMGKKRKKNKKDE